MKTSFVLTILLLLIPVSSLGQEKFPSLPEGEIIFADDGTETGIMFSKEDYRDIVHMYNDLLLFSSNDELWRKMHSATLELERIQHNRLTLCLDTKNSLEITADDMYSLWQEEHDLRVSSEKKQKIKEVFIGLGAGVGGALVGAAITALLILL